MGITARKSVVVSPVKVDGLLIVSLSLVLQPRVAVSRPR